ncbi:aspartate/glutamate racemase family protein [Sphingomonas radiodurans]|uniref:aspartate/glutamate racemase family protein n=1 Tax=Sphingomonas radiodurans TaxID=2890321 RepID=UPI001E505C54|nr:aspartate/glutamate racemase family protein [Sphingomonas radiodurans]WBH17999.1 aspartate/glutamate racemase family protein [Sphingomonas radiodurans]
MRIGLIGTPYDPFNRAAPAPELAALLPAEATLIAFPSRVGAFPYTPLERAMQAIGHAEAAITATEQGCDAVVIDSVGDYGLDVMRAALAIPAIGSGAAGMAAAAAHGRFAIVTVWPASMNFVVTDLLRAYGYEAACLSIDNVGQEGDLDRLAGPDGYLADVKRGEDALLNAIAAAVARAAAQGAEAVLLGCTCMSPIAARIAATATIPVINPLAEGVKAALAATPLRSAPHVREGRIDLLRTMVASVANAPIEDCPVCVATAA